MKQKIELVQEEEIKRRKNGIKTGVSTRDILVVNLKEKQRYVFRKQQEEQNEKNHKKKIDLT